MSTIITHNTGTIAPAVVEGFEAVQSARSIVHTILGRPDPDITYRPAGLRTGTLTLVFASGADAASARAILVVPQVFTISDPDVPEVTMPFVVAGGDISSSLADSRKSWIVTVPYQEVTP